MRLAWALPPCINLHPHFGFRFSVTVNHFLFVQRNLQLLMQLQNPPTSGTKNSTATLPTYKKSSGWRLTRTACLSDLSMISRGPYVFRPPKDPITLTSFLSSSGRLAHTASCSAWMRSFSAGYLFTHKKRTKENPWPDEHTWTLNSRASEVKRQLNRRAQGLKPYNNGWVWFPFRTIGNWGCWVHHQS